MNDKVVAKFKVDDVVQRANQAEAVGVVRECKFNRQVDEWQYSVQFGAGTKTVLESSLILFSAPASPWDALASGTVSGAGHLVAVLTYHRLRKPPTRIAASFATSRTEIHPHQFRPLLKFLDHPEKRLLIADDVGLGKTIEAGYILRELEARQSVERVLVVCPSRLTSKWRRELDQRFQERFDVVTGRDFLDLVQRVRRGREPDPFRWIVSLESARPKEVADAIDEMQLFVDLLIVDEAHRLRNPDTLQHGLGATLEPLSDAMVFLTATPVQNRLEDLWNLLRLLQPESFQDWGLFQRQIQANRPLFQAQDALRRRPPDAAAASEALRTFFEMTPTRSAGLDDLQKALLDRVQTLGNDRAEVTALQYDLSALSPTAPIISRTRKVEALPNRAVRSAKWHPVRLSGPEREFYESVRSLCRTLWNVEAGSPASEWPLQTAYRITASCIPAAVEYFTDRLSGGSAPSLHSLLEEETNGAAEPTSLYGGENGTALRTAVEQYRRLRDVDTKFGCLKRALQQMWEGDEARGEQPRKVVVFSFFRRTLEYLNRELMSAGVACRMIHGLVPVRDRERAIDDFLDDPAIRVLLTSEVGGEGIDLQRASALVNYDLPWNPMVVEQRIGRIDRIGQRAERINIINLVVEDSIEERILQRLFDRIGVFRNSIGELDDILGDEVRDLTALALSGALSPEDLEKRVCEREDALERKLKEAREVLRRVDGLLAADQALVDEIDAVTGERQLPSPEEVRLFLNHYLGTKFLGSQLPAAAAERVVKVELQPALAEALERRAATLGPETALVARRIASGPIDLTLSRDAAYRHPNAELVHLRHPLVTLAVKETEDTASSVATFSLRLSKTKRLDAGSYVFLVTLVEIKGQRPSIRLCTAMWGLNSSRLLVDPDVTTPILLEMSDRAESAEPLQLPSAALETARARIDDGVNELVASWETREKRLDRLRREQQHASRLAYLALQLERAEERLAKVKARSRHPTALRLNEARARKARLAYEVARSSPPAPLWEGVERQDIALGILTVSGGTTDGQELSLRR